MARLDELRRARRYPKLKTVLPAHRVGAKANNMQRVIALDVLPVLPKGNGANDPNDAFLLAMALAGEAEYLVTGDRYAGLQWCNGIGRGTSSPRPPFAATAL